jgi:chromosome condensin MukBEF complex kleisin-like MukF subunit
MLSQLLSDAQALAGALPTLQSAANAVEADLEASPPVTLTQLQTDAAALTTALAPVIADIGAMQADLSALPQSSHPDLGASLDAINWTAIIAKIQALLAAGITNLPEILAALQAAGIVIPPQVLAIVELVIAILGGQAPTS